MEQNKTRNILIIVVAVILIAIVVGLYYVNQSKTPVSSQNTVTPEGVNNPQTNPTAAANSGAPQPSKITGGPLGSAKNPVMTYPILAENGKFNPTETTIAKGGKVQVSIAAIDANYDISFAAPLGTHLAIKKGQLVVFPFDASESKVGTYTFTSKDPQGGTMTGTLVVQ